MLPIAIGQTEILIIVAVVVLLFGVSRLPQLGKNLAEGIHEFKKASRQAKAEDEDEAAKPKGENDA